MAHDARKGAKEVAMREPRSCHWRVAQMLNKLHCELGSQGFQPVGITFDPPNGTTEGQFVSYMVDYFKLTYPIGYSAKADVDTYLGRTGNQILNIPQIVVIDRSGMIRSTSGGRGGVQIRGRKLSA